MSQRRNPHVLAIGVAAALAPMLLASSARGSLKQQNADFNSFITSQLAIRDAAGADLFTQATQAEERGDHDAAADLYGRVRERDPWFFHATRRLCGVEAERGHRDRAIVLCREALAADHSPVNEASLARTLLAGSPPPAADAVQEAYGHARNAADNNPNDAFAQVVLCEAAMAANELRALDECVRKLQAIDPRTLSTMYFSAVDHASQQHYDEALSDLDQAHELGLPDEPYRGMRRAIEDDRWPMGRYGRLATQGLVGWLSVGALLLGLAAILSALTLGAISRAGSGQTGRARGAELALRRTYRVVLWLTCAYYYLSLPIVALAVLGLGGGLIYMFFAIGQIPIKLVFIALLFVVWSLVAIARSLFVRSRDEDPGEPLDLRDQPKLRAVLDEVAGRIGARPVDAVYITPGTEIAVLERGGLVRQLRGKGQRCLVLGAGVLEGMRVRELKAVLAHEYGHFHNEDTAGGGLALAVRRSLLTMAMHLAQRGVASSLNPAWWFVRGFHALFLRVSQGASRLQEVLADRWAAFAYGSEAFGRGLAHVVDRSVRFSAHMSATLDELIPAKRPVQNLYAFRPEKPIDGAKIEEAVRGAMNRPPSPYDSHPPPADRIAWVQRMAVDPPPESEEDAADAWTLIASRQDIESRMTDVVRSTLASRGIRLLAEA